MNISQRMSRIKSKDTKPELIFFEILQKNINSEIDRNSRKVFGCPDFFISKYRVAIFIDGCFWHGCFQHYKIPKTNFGFWFKKLRNNVKRDYKINFLLKRQNFLVLRFWEHEIKNNPQKCINKVKRYLFYSHFVFLTKFFNRKKKYIKNILLEGADQQGKTQLCSEIQTNFSSFRYCHNSQPLFGFLRYLSYLKYGAQLIIFKKIIDRSFLSEYLYSPILRRNRVCLAFLKFFRFILSFTSSLMIVCCRTDFVEEMYIKRDELLSFEEICKLRLSFVNYALFFHGRVLLYDPILDTWLNNFLMEIENENFKH